MSKDLFVRTSIFTCNYNFHLRPTGLDLDLSMNPVDVGLDLLAQTLILSHISLQDEKGHS